MAILTMAILTMAILTMAILTMAILTKEDLAAFRERSGAPLLHALSEALGAHAY